MLLNVRVQSADPAQLLGGDEERHEEFWFGQGLAWADRESSSLRLSLKIDLPRIVTRTKRRDRDERFSVGFCDPYAYSAAGLMALFLARLRLSLPGGGCERIEIELVSYPERPYSREIASRLFSPLGYRVEAAGGTLRLDCERRVGDALTELPVLLLALDRRARLFLSSEELAEIGHSAGRLVERHPAQRAIELALQGRATPLRFLLPPGTDIGREKDELHSEFVSIGPELSTKLIARIPIAEAQQKHALKMFSRMNVDPKWLMYLPAGVASLQAAGETLERPESGLAYFRDEQIENVVVEEKHMGSRGIVVLCRSLKTARERFGVDGELPGCAYTRNGRRFFKDEDTEAVFLERLGRALEQSNFWKRFSTNFVCFDGEIMPWSLKAADSSEESGLVEAGRAVLAETSRVLGDKPDSQLKNYWKALVQSELCAVEDFDRMFKHYRTEASNLAALKFAPFHLLAVEGQTFFGRSHLWHMQTLGRLARSGDGFLITTRYEVISSKGPESWSKAISWWEELSEKGSEGLVLKPFPFVPRGRRGIAQPALKFRSPEHLRLVYGPSWNSREGIESLLCRDSLKKRRSKHRRILRQFALSIEAVERFVKRDSLSAVHECVLGVLAQEVAPTMGT